MKIDKVELRTCRQCGAKFMAARKGRKPRLYCDTCRAARRAKQHANLRDTTHVCGERCQIIQQMIAEDPPLTLDAMGARLNLSRERVRQIMVRHGWTKPPGSFGFPKGGTLCKTCGQRVKARRATYYADLRAHNATHPPHDKTKWEQRALIVAAYLAGWRIEDIRAEVGLAKAEQIYHAIHASGVRPNRGRRWARALGPDGKMHRVQDLG